MNNFLKPLITINTLKYFSFVAFLFVSNVSYAQSGYEDIKGTVFDGSSKKTLYGVYITVDSSAVMDSTQANGVYVVKSAPGIHSLTFELEGFQSKKITEINLRKDEAVYLNVVLYPVSKNLKPSSKDSVVESASIISTTFYKEKQAAFKNNAISLSGFDLISSEFISPGTDKNAAQLLKRLSGVTLLDNPYTPQLQSLTIKGMGERYNQVLLNGAVFNNLDPLSRSFPLDFIPTEAIESVSVHKVNDGSIPADFAGGSVNIQTKDFPDRNFYYVQAGAGAFDNTSGKTFFGDKRGDLEVLGFPGKVRELPGDFPNHKSQYSFNELNVQERVRLSKQLNNNLAPINYGSSAPNMNFILGYGHTFKLKQGEKIGITAFLKQRKTELIEDVTMQAVPAIATNPFPFTATNRVLINAQSQDTRYGYNSDFGGVLNASIAFGRNKISVKNLFGSVFSNTLTSRDQYTKRDEDTLATNGLHYLTENKKFVNSQVSGVHALGEDSKFKMDWVASYSFISQNNPDERNFLLNNSGNNYQIASPEFDSTTPAKLFTNSSRNWRKLKENNFFGAFNISVPFNLINQTQNLSGGVSIQSRNRTMFSDLLLVTGKGYAPLDNLLASDRYYLGGLSLSNYYFNDPDLGGDLTVPNNRGHYTTSSNIGASYIKLETKLSNTLSANVAIRLESSSNMVSNTQFDYIKGFKNPELNTLNVNQQIIKSDLLPSLHIKYQLVDAIHVYAAYSKTLNRPHLQELSLYRYYDASSFMVKEGNAVLKNTEIDNADIGINAYLKNGSSLMLSGFYKKIVEPIETILYAYSSTNGIYVAKPYNAPPATVKGIEAAFKTNLSFISSASWLTKTSLFGNATILKSKVEAGYIRNQANPELGEHSLSGSPDYTVNTGITFHEPGVPQLSLLFNTTADYISTVGSGAISNLPNGNSVQAIPDYRVKGREQLDLQISQKLFRSRIQAIMGVNNLLNAPFVVYQDLNGNKKFDEPLKLKTNNAGRLGYYEAGTDNTVVSIKPQRLYYLTLSYMFK